MTIATLIPGCFGLVDQLFAIHPRDRDRAFELLTFCRENNFSLDEVLSEIEAYLRNQECGSDHIQEQLDRVRRHFEKWLVA
jgi:hypothetical protein